MMQTTTRTPETINKDRQILIQRLKEANLTTRRFLKVDDTKRAFEKEWQNNLYTPEELSKYPSWGICGGGGLVLIDADNKEMAELLRKTLPPTFEVRSSRRKLPHFYYKVVGGEVQNKTLYLPETNDASGEIRVNNQYLVSAGTKTFHGVYKIIANRPIATLTYERFMESVKLYLGKDSSQKLTEEQITKGVSEGERHTVGIKYANYLIGVQGLDYQTALVEMLRWNRTCSPPNNETEIKQMVLDAANYQKTTTQTNNENGKKKSKDKEEIKVKHSPGFAENGTVFEQIADGKYTCGKDLEETFVFQHGDDTFQPLERCPWHLATIPIDYADAHSLWNDVYGFIYDHLFLPKKELYSVLTSWTLSTWIQELWPVVPYVFFYGPVASGKTRGLEVLHHLCYRGILASNITPAALFRICDLWHPTILLDETEIYNQQTKVEVVGLLNSGYRRGQYAFRARVKESGTELESFDVFGFKALAGTQGLRKALESRCLMIKMLKAKRKINLFIDEKRAIEIRNKLLGWRLYTLAECEQGEQREHFLEGIPSLDFADGRLIELFTPLLAVSNHGREELVKYAQNLYEMRSSEEKAGEEAEILEILSKNNLTDEKNIVLTKDLTDVFNSSRDDKEKWKTKSIGYLVRRLGFEKTHTRNGNGWLIDKDRLSYLLQVYGIEEATQTTPLESVHSIHSVHASELQDDKKPVTNSKESLNINQYFPEGQYPICFICHKPVGNPNDLTNIDGLPCHTTCMRQILAQRKEAS